MQLKASRKLADRGRVINMETSKANTVLALQQAGIGPLISSLVDDPTVFVARSDSLSEKLLSTTKFFFDAQAANETAQAPLQELLLDGFGIEQVWGEMELQNDWAITNLTRSIGVLNQKVGKQPIKLLVTKTKKEISKSGTRKTKRRIASDKNAEEKEIGQVGAEDSDEVEGRPSMETEPQAGGEIEEEKEMQTEGRSTRKVRGAGGSNVDDGFFKLSEMEQYLDQMDRKEMGELGGGDSEDEEDVDLFADPDTLDDEEDESLQQQGKDIFYKDLIGSFADHDSETNESHGNFDDQDFSEEGEGDRSEGETSNDSDAESESSNDAKGKKRSQSSFEKAATKLKRKISELEEKNLEGKSWAMKGEAMARHRPKDSLLDEEVEFETSAKPPPVVSEEMTQSLEEIVKQRVKDEAWDDVERKDPLPTHEWKPVKMALDHEKSKQSLAEVYEAEYRQQTQGVQDDQVEEVNEEHEELRNLFKTLCHKLDSLANFHYTPAMAKTDIEVVANVPAIQMEEVIPLAVSENVRLAPEEIYDKRQAVKTGESEKTDTDRKRYRRKKKLIAHKRQQARTEKKKATERADGKNKPPKSRQEALDELKGGGMKVKIIP